MKCEIAVVGGGLTGLAISLGLAGKGVDTALIAPPSSQDGRTTALFGASLEYLASLDVLEAVKAVGAPLQTMRIIDDTGRILRAPIVEFESAEIGLDSFGVNALNRDLNQVMSERLADFSNVTRFASPLRKMQTDQDMAHLELEDGTRISTHLVVGADGRNSLVRKSAGIEVRTWPYPQSAMVLNFSHQRPHHNISTEFHRPAGPFTQVPLPGNASSLVWVEKPDIARTVQQAAPTELARMVEERMHSILGAVELTSEIQCFPLSGGRAHSLTAQRVALVGEAAHVFPPIGAQGLNLGLRDVASIIDLVGSGKSAAGSDEMLHAYENARRTDIAVRSFGVDLLNRSLLADMLPMQILRTAGLQALASIAPARRFAMREGVSPGSGIFGMRDHSALVRR
ncbi:UbiH/UbiF family hydroxylase [Aureimonas fodinaquatilis]|uniref:UbiH/UbiF family hydroxylase n=1 Tax=Aureimonas fodinaquatilis TaxID=2565783 RepID=A0A5B0DX42_9HYPH|nr:UbiH/UbiF family hydroxylase [Aureimonas fodinaquatilis]KAA0970435.1 UbiH/UbiF family hydroxylase [Aureimonas fodinaquatilis]